MCEIIQHSRQIDRRPALDCPLHHRGAMRQSGFSLIETMIAASIVIVALTGLAQLFGLAIDANQRARSRTLATLLAQEKLEELMAFEGETSDGVDFIDARGLRIAGDALPPPGTVYMRQWSADPMPAGPGAVVLQVSVSLSQDVSGGDAARIIGVKTSRTPRRSRRRRVCVSRRARRACDPSAMLRVDLSGVEGRGSGAG